jgi:hypothetical protein
MTDTQKIMNTVVKMTAAFAMQLLVDNALPLIDRLDDDLDLIDSELQRYNYTWSVNGKELRSLAAVMQAKLSKAVAKAQEKISGDEAREEARAAAAARGMPEVLQWTKQKRTLVKELWSQHAPACMRGMDTEGKAPKYYFFPNVQGSMVHDDSRGYVPTKIMRVEGGGGALRAGETWHWVTEDGTEGRTDREKLKRDGAMLHEITDLSTLCLAPNNLMDADMNEVREQFVNNLLQVKMRIGHIFWSNILILTLLRIIIILIFLHFFFFSGDASS